MVAAVGFRVECPFRLGFTAVVLVVGRWDKQSQMVFGVQLIRNICKKLTIWSGLAHCHLASECDRKRQVWVSAFGFEGA